jgi:hypothetical protein
MNVREIRIRPQNRMSPQQRLRSSAQIIRLVDAEAANALDSGQAAGDGLGIMNAHPGWPDLIAIPTDTEKGSVLTSPTQRLQ